MAGPKISELECWTDFPDLRRQNSVKSSQTSDRKNQNLVAPEGLDVYRPKASIANRGLRQETDVAGHIAVSFLVAFAEGVAAEEVFAHVSDGVMQCLARITRFEAEFT